MGYTDDQVLELLPWASRFARACASKLPSHLDRDDLQSAGVLEFLRAASRYDVAKGASFRGFCAVRIRGAVLDELRRWDWAPRSVHKNHRRITRITGILIERREREPTHAELAAALDMETSELAAFQSMSQPRQLVSLDEMSENNHGEEGLALTERLADPQTARPDVACLTAEDRRTLMKCMANLPRTGDGHRPSLSARHSLAGHRRDAGRHPFPRLAVASPGPRQAQTLLASLPSPRLMGTLGFDFWLSERVPGLG